MKILLWRNRFSFYLKIVQLELQLPILSWAPPYFVWWPSPTSTMRSFIGGQWHGYGAIYRLDHFACTQLNLQESSHMMYRIVLSLQLLGHDALLNHNYDLSK